MKRNCWEIKKCGREPGGNHTGEFGVCPASEEKKLNGIHGGENGGRSCWVISGTLCNGEVQGTYAKKYKNCGACDFYERVRKEEYPGFQLSAVLLNILV